MSPMRKGEKKKLLQCISSCLFNRLLIMGCYGIGLTRLMATTVEILTPKEFNGIRWPRRIAPYQVAILPPKVRSFSRTLFEEFQFLER